MLGSRPKTISDQVRERICLIVERGRRRDGRHHRRDVAQQSQHQPVEPFLRTGLAPCMQHVCAPLRSGGSVPGVVEADDLGTLDTALAEPYVRIPPRLTPTASPRPTAVAEFRAPTLRDCHATNVARRIAINAIEDALHGS
ncbi:hypothetical protein GCM10009753_44400 [Streptantibioticus ferralitis]